MEIFAFKKSYFLDDFWADFSMLAFFMEVSDLV
jgi:hypothetical protein